MQEDRRGGRRSSALWAWHQSTRQELLARGGQQEEIVRFETSWMRFIEFDTGKGPLCDFHLIYISTCTHPIVERGSISPAWLIIILIMIHKIGKKGATMVGLVASRRLLSNIRYGISQKDERFLRFINFDANYLNQVPIFFKPLQPIMEPIKNCILTANQFMGLPWWLVLMLSSMFVRMTIFPLILVQMKRISRIGPVAPAFVFLKDAWKYSELSTWGKIKSSVKVYRDICKQQNFRLSTIFVYNLAYYPLLISMIFGIRKLLACPELSGATFLHITNFGDIDPYFILPTLTVGLYYFNFQRFITPENEKTLMTKIRRVCQVFLILWYPFLCSWPSGIVLYMCSNALISVLQSSIMKTPWFLSKMNQKIILYNSILQSVEYDKGTSEGIIEAIKKGEENFGSLAIKEELLHQQTVDMLKKLQEEEKNPPKEEEGDFVSSKDK